jgi:hypothetical protein
MSDPSRPAGQPVSGSVESGGIRAWTARSVGTDGPEWQAWSWASGKSGFSWLGALLVVLGVALLIDQLVPQLSFTSLLLIALAVAFGAAWLVGGWVGATIPTLVLGAWGLSRVAIELGWLTGDGWTLLFVGIALLVSWALGRAQRVRREWALWVGLALLILGFAQVSSLTAGGWDLLWPLALVVLGLILIARRRTA